MKKIICAFAIVFVLFPSCKKYQEGPAFTLITKKARLSNTWILESYFENNQDKTSDALIAFKDFHLVLDKNNMKYTKTFMAFGLLSYGETGSWNLSSDKMQVHFTPDQTIIKPYVWKIVKLKNKNCGFTYTDNNSTYKVYLKQK